MSLKESLIKMEAHNSIFENAIRSLEIPTCAVFGKGENLSPVSFTEASDTISTKDSAKVAESFPQTSSASKNKVLSASGTNASPLKADRLRADTMSFTVSKKFSEKITLFSELKPVLKDFLKASFLK